MKHAHLNCPNHHRNNLNSLHGQVSQIQQAQDSAKQTQNESETAWYVHKALSSVTSLTDTNQPERIFPLDALLAEWFKLGASGLDHVLDHSRDAGDSVR